MPNHWHFKEEVSILSAKREIYNLRRTLGLPNHRGLEDIWYTIWNIRLSRFVRKCRSLVVGPQRVVSHEQVDQDGRVRKESRIPDFALLRVFRKRLRLNGMDFERMKIVALMELKPCPMNSELNSIYGAIKEAKADLNDQAEVLFSGNPEYKAIVGVAIAGDWWSYEKAAEDYVSPLRLRPIYQLLTPQSDAAMKAMTEEIKQLPGFEKYANTQF
ncbi:uncharacterized protein FOMMEDRAFT_159729 [Fomitiporia mediterranea MF3/22]|uniref:uncharacterized protein n=1 Tax=Fomitiporia mediterranea (strain MF3/22) TaxID=694068 RepID=UPI0004408E84|nr:uncharacterized protein FOMMEDRAFT_159729 [Fomitiporia mediterranea MF3/22]EJD00115.1 hypothetical protein FOMMEDRAFT_159729 [Fomitiporia mediterranea MF3/22]